VRSHRGLTAGILIACFGLAGALLLAGTFAAGVSLSFEAEGTALTSPAAIVDNSTASGGKAIQFRTGGVSQDGLPASYSIERNVIKDSSGTIFTPHGVSLTTTEWKCDGTDYITDAAAYGIMHSTWKANIIRIPLSQDQWLPGSSSYCSRYQSNVATWIANAHKAGLRVIIDLHWSDKGNLSTQQGQQCMADNNSVTFLQQVAST
jgi:hypothetical protein